MRIQDESDQKITKEFATRLTQSRIDAGYNKAELARKININKSAMTAYEQGASIPKSSTAQKIADALNIDLNWLISGVQGDVTFSKEKITNDQLWIIEKVKTSSPEKIERIRKMIELMQ